MCKKGKRQELFPSALKVLLSSESICKVGVAIQNDVLNLLLAYNVPVHNYIDLDKLSTVVNGFTAGLNNLYQMYLSEAPFKNKAPGRWSEHELEPKHIIYAANDVLASLKILKRMVVPAQATESTAHLWLAKKALPGVDWALTSVSNVQSSPPTSLVADTFKTFIRNLFPRTQSSAFLSLDTASEEVEPYDQVTMSGITDTWKSAIPVTSDLVLHPHWDYALWNLMFALTGAHWSRAGGYTVTTKRIINKLVPKNWSRLLREEHQLLAGGLQPHSESGFIFWNISPQNAEDLPEMQTVLALPEDLKFVVELAVEKWIQQGRVQAALQPPHANITFSEKSLRFVEKLSRALHDEQEKTA